MPISPVSNSIFSNLLSIKNPHKTKAIELFGKDLAKSLKIRDGSWEKVMESWDISFIGCTSIKESNNCFSTQPKRIYCETQSKDGLILKIPTFNLNDGLILKIPTFNLDDILIKSADLITPYGYINLEFKHNELLHQFIDRLAEKFHKQPLDQTNSDYVHHSFTLSPDKKAAFKPSCHYDICGSDMREEFGKNEYSRTEALQVYEKLKDHVNIEIEGQAMLPKSISHPPQYIAIGTQTDDITHMGRGDLTRNKV